MFDVYQKKRVLNKKYNIPALSKTKNIIKRPLYHLKNIELGHRT